MSTAHQPQSPFRRVVTGHDEQGRAVVSSDDVFQLDSVANGAAFFGLVWTAPDLPVNNNDNTEGRSRDAGLTIKRGSVIRISDASPGSSSGMHRTNSLDYGIVISGQIELELDDGSKTLLNPGDFIIQRGTIHSWRNPSATQWCRMIFILTEAKPYEHNGKPYLPVP